MLIAIHQLNENFKRSNTAVLVVSPDSKVFRRPTTIHTYYRFACATNLLSHACRRYRGSPSSALLTSLMMKSTPASNGVRSMSVSLQHTTCALTIWVLGFCNLLHGASCSSIHIPLCDLWPLRCCLSILTMFFLRLNTYHKPVSRFILHFDSA